MSFDGALSLTLVYVVQTEDMVRQLELTGAKAVVTHPSLLETVRAAAARVPSVAEVACTGGDALPEGVLSFDELLRTGREETPSVDVDLQKDPLMLLFSSGTTGLPKGVTLTNYTLGSVLLQTSNKDFGWERLGNDHIPCYPADCRSSFLCRLSGLATLTTAVRSPGRQPLFARALSPISFI